MVLTHILFHLAAAKANELRNKRQNDTDQRGKTEPPVNGQQDDDHDNGSCNRSDKIRELMSNNSQKVQQDIRHDPGERQPAVIHDHPHIQLVKVRENPDNRADHKIDRYVRDERSNGRQ